MRTVRLVAAAAAACFALSGCSLIPGMSGQSGVQACAAISGSVQQSMSKLSDALTAASSDPKAATAALQEFVSELDSSRGKVTNADVGAALDKTEAAAKKLVALLKSAGSDPSAVDSEKLTTIAADIESGLTEFATACAKI